ncbi:TOP2c incomplete domain containing protein [Pandoravirus quercus]|uniref:TOP2c incomplete domain containing protein n=2 Tax=Pandoravirus TaxID=2060084 RepID=A0A2U7U8G6_9VIRU|nr:TOP2c incomplete domain containing protein [Pandoravirus quercus]AVK74723.1 TOP2c incomplete domain containing protein [Pandoravirus quercus]QBZ80899.1 TOP2c superfamily incomplete domain containing protein [Pandoravirus celtis]
MHATKNVSPTRPDSATGDGTADQIHRQKVALISRHGDSARTVAATMRTCADSITMDLADESVPGLLVPWHAAPVPDWVSLPARITKGIEAAGADRACLAAVVFQARDASVESEDDLFVGVLPRPLDARIYRAPIALALRVDIDAGDDIAWIDMDAEACDLVLDAWLAGPAPEPELGARAEFDADSSAMSTDDEGRGTEGAPAATTTDDDDERHGVDGAVAASRGVPKARRRAKATPALRQRSRRNSATVALADDDRSSHATDDEDVPTVPRRRLKAPRRAPRRPVASGYNGNDGDEDEDEDDEDEGGHGAGLADDGGRTLDGDDDEDDDVCRDSDGDLHTAEVDDDMGEDDMGDDDHDDDELDEIDGANGDMDDDLADDEEGDMDDDPNAE